MQQSEVLTAKGHVATIERFGAARRRAFLNTAAVWVVSAGGLGTIASILAIVGFIFTEVVPLWRAPSAHRDSSFVLGTAARTSRLSTDEHRHLLPVARPDGKVDFVRLGDGNIAASLPFPDLNGASVDRILPSSPNDVLALTSDGRLLLARVQYEYAAGDIRRQPQPTLTASRSWSPTGDRSVPLLVAASAPQGDVITAVFAGADGVPRLFAVTEKRSLFGAQRSEVRHELPLRHGGQASVIALDADGNYAYVGSSNGYVQRWDLRDKEAPKVTDAADVTKRRDRSVTALSLLIGDQSLIVGDAGGRVTRWFVVRDPEIESGWRLQRIRKFKSHAAAVTAIAASPRDKGFITGGADGRVYLHHATTGRTLLELATGGRAISAVAFSPKANGALALDDQGSVANWSIDNRHPEITLRTLFGKVWYEGYDAPAYVWQSTGGTDEFEPKFSLVPLIVGTMKGTLYALLVAVPLAVLGALYTSQFCHPRLRNLIKPTVEIMAALPSVVLGFLAGLWLAPMIERIVPAVMAMTLMIPAVIFAAGFVWRSLPAAVHRHVRPGTELLLLIPLILLAAQTCIWANTPLEQAFFGGDFRSWLFDWGGRFDQRNCIVVGFAMGFAVIPIIFTISEDAISNVPSRLVSASLALGATPWQTALRVVLPTASAGIFSAIMVGFGRAVGETMIVLMATGNTPVLDWSIFTGMRTLSANIAVEIPEAPFGGTLYRILFLAALLLFMVTFVVNTVAELVRLRLRRRYQNL
jgi:phosphate transport system permease protein